MVRRRGGAFSSGAFVWCFPGSAAVRQGAEARLRCLSSSVGLAGALRGGTSRLVKAAKFRGSGWASSGLGGASWAFFAISFTAGNFMVI